MVVWAQRIVERLVDWWIRRSVWVRFGQFGLVVFCSGIGSGLVVRFSSGEWDLELSNPVAAPSWFSAIVALIGLLTILASFWKESKRQAELRRDRTGRRIVVLEQRGLHLGGDSPLADLFTDEGCPVVPRVMDLRDRFQDQQLIDPRGALEEVSSLPRDLRGLLAGDRSGGSRVVYGGLVPVPLAFLTGMLLDDEFRVEVFDWDRHGQQWRALDAKDDGERATISGVEDMPPNCPHAVIAVSASYRVDTDAVTRLCPRMPRIDLVWPSMQPDNHWSAEKQAALAQQFLATCIALEGRGVRHLHAFVAAQNSVAVNLGRRYDRRNLPRIDVYQYERSANPAYPWAIRMPTHGVARGELIESQRAACVE